MCVPMIRCRRSCAVRCLASGCEFARTECRAVVYEQTPDRDAPARVASRRILSVGSDPPTLRTPLTSSMWRLRSALRGCCLAGTQTLTGYKPIEASQLDVELQ